MVKEQSAKYATEKKITPRDCSKAELIVVITNAGGGVTPPSRFLQTL